MGPRTRKTILAGLALAVIQCATDGRAEAVDLEWLLATSDRYSLVVEYPAALFHDPLMTYGEGDTVWLGPNRDSATLMITAVPAGDQTPYQRICASGCPDIVSKSDNPAMAAVSGHIGGRSYYSKCRLADGRQPGSPTEMHCFHIIYPASARATYEPVVAHMAASMR